MSGALWADSPEYEDDQGEPQLQPELQPETIMNARKLGKSADQDELRVGRVGIEPTTGGL